MRILVIIVAGYICW